MDWLFAVLSWGANLSWLRSHAYIGLQHLYGFCRPPRMCRSRRDRKYLLGFTLVLAAGFAFLFGVAGAVWLASQLAFGLHLPIGCRDRILSMSCKHVLADRTIFLGCNYTLAAWVRTLLMGFSSMVAVRTVCLGCSWEVAAFAPMRWIAQILCSCFVADRNFIVGCKSTMACWAAGSHTLYGLHGLLGCRFARFQWVASGLGLPGECPDRRERISSMGCRLYVACVAPI